MFKPQKNYLAWNIKESDFPKSENMSEKIKFILGYGILAPSTFNSQPWLCRIDGNHLKIYLNPDRITQRSDKTGRFAHISIGCFIEHILVAAGHFHLEADCKLIGKRSEGRLLMAEIKFKEQPRRTNSANEKLFNSITVRATNRSTNINKPIDPSIIKKLIRGINSQQSVVVVNETFRKEMIDISWIGDRHIWGDFQFRKEHVVWVRHNLTRAYDGMPGFGVGVSTIPSFFAYPMILSPIFPVFQAVKNKKSLKSTYHFVTIFGEDSPIEWLKVGIYYAFAGLLLMSEGIVTAPMGQFIESEPERLTLKEVVKPDSKLMPQMFFRMGYPSAGVPHSPRMPVSHILI